MKALVLCLLMGTMSVMAKSNYSKESIMGVWQLTKFVIVKENGDEQDWCVGAKGSIAYLPGLMSVAINCTEVRPDSGAEKIGGHLFYSGPYDFDRGSNEVVHRVRNYSHPSLNKVYRRSVEMSDENHLRLIGYLDAGKKVIVEWKRREAFSYDSSLLAGTWELVGSENEIEGSDETIPFCHGFYGTILYTPGGYVAVSINCGEKKSSVVSEPADQFGRKFFYSGSYDLVKDVLIQNPENASESFLIGKPAKREMSIIKDILTLKGTNNSKFVARWRKLSSFSNF